jgi:hypothetical protein
MHSLPKESDFVTTHQALWGQYESRLDHRRPQSVRDDCQLRFERGGAVSPPFEYHNEGGAMRVRVRASIALLGVLDQSSASQLARVLPNLLFGLANNAPH